MGNQLQGGSFNKQSEGFAAENRNAARSKFLGGGMPSSRPQMPNQSPFPNSGTTPLYGQAGFASPLNDHDLQRRTLINSMFGLGGANK